MEFHRGRWIGNERDESSCGFECAITLEVESASTCFKQKDNCSGWIDNEE